MSVLLIDPFSSGVDYHELLQEEGIEYYVVRTHRAIYSGLSDGSWVPHLVLDKSSEHALGEVLHLCHEHGVDIVITGAESGVPLAEALKAELGLAADVFGDHGRRFWDKSLLYAVLRAAGLRTPKQLGLIGDQDTVSDMPTILNDADYPVVVKPTVGAFSVGVRVADNAHRAREAIEEITSTPGIFGGEPQRAIIQEYIAGREYVVDSFSHADEHRVLAVCVYDKHPSSTGAMVYDRLRWLAWQSPESVMLSEYALAVLRALEHREGSVHMEIVVDSDGPCLIDLGARPHGAKHPMKTYQLTGASQLHAEVDVAAGRETPRSAGYTLGAHASIEFLSLRRRASIRVDSAPTELLQMRFVLSGDVRAEPGSTYPETHSLLDSQTLGLIFISGVDDTDVIENATELREAFSSMLERVDDVP